MTFSEAACADDDTAGQMPRALPSMVRVVKLGYRDGIDRDAGIGLVCRALWEAADADSATGGPDALRGIYPIVATITADGFARVSDDELARQYEAIAEEVRSAGVPPR